MINIAGHQGLVVSAIHRKLQAQGGNHLITRSRSEFDLLDHATVADSSNTKNPTMSSWPQPG